nr:ABC transporter ATP-binding protein [Halolamina pelagica]
MSLFGIGAAGTTERETAAAASTPTDGDDEPPELSVEDVALSYGDGDPVVETDKLVVPAGEVTALVGPNGSGKSTLLKAMDAELEPDRGSVRFDGRRVAEYSTSELATRLGLLSQENTAPDSTSVRELVTYGRYPHRGFFEGLSESDEAAIDRAIDRVGIDHLADRNVGDLSGANASWPGSRWCSPRRPTRCCSTSRRTISTSTTSFGFSTPPKRSTRSAASRSVSSSTTSGRRHASRTTSSRSGTAPPTSGGRPTRW